MKDILGKYPRERSGRDFVYGRIGSLELYLYPKDDPTNVNETNLKRLLDELEKVESNYHSSIEKAKTELLSLSPSVAKQYKPKGLVKADEETRRRLYDTQVYKELFANVRNINIEILRESVHEVMPNRKPMLIIMGNRAVLGLSSKDVPLVSKIFSESNDIDELFEKLTREKIRIEIESYEFEVEDVKKQIDTRVLTSKKLTDKKTKNLLKKFVKELKTYANSQ